MERLAAWVETENALRGRELAAFAAPHAHVAIAALFKAGWTAADLMALIEDKAKDAKGELQARRQDNA